MVIRCRKAGKVCYPKPWQAVAAKKRMYERRADAWILEPYRCKTCGKWHLGTPKS